MKKFNLWAGMIALFLCVGFASCGDDDDNNADKAGTGTVFPAGTKKVATINDGYETSTFNYADGKLVSVKIGKSEECTFTYSGSKVTMVCKSSSDKTVYTMNIGSDGFITGGTGVYTEVYEGKTYEEKSNFSFSYSNGYLTGMDMDGSDSDGDKSSDSYRFTWKDGNLVKTVSKWKSTEEGKTEEGEETYTATYGSDLNVANISFFDEVADLDELEYAYYAGLLGKSTKNLLKTVVNQYESYSDTYNFSYTFNDDKYPVKVIIDGHVNTYTYE